MRAWLGRRERAGYGCVSRLVGIGVVGMRVTYAMYYAAFLGRVGMRSVLGIYIEASRRALTHTHKQTPASHAWVYADRR